MKIDEKNKNEKQLKELLYKYEHNQASEFDLYSMLLIISDKWDELTDEDY